MEQREVLTVHALSVLSCCVTFLRYAVWQGLCELAAVFLPDPKAVFFQLHVFKLI